MRLTSLALAVRKMMGVSREASRARMRLAVSNPSIRGIMTSSRMRAKSCLQHAA